MKEWFRRLAKIPPPPIEDCRAALDQLNNRIETLSDLLGERRRRSLPVTVDRRHAAKCR